MSSTVFVTQSIGSVIGIIIFAVLAAINLEKADKSDNWSDDYRRSIRRWGHTCQVGVVVFAALLIASITGWGL